MSRMPERTREYRSYIFDSRNWDGFAPRPVEDVTEADWDTAFGATAKGSFFVAQAAAPHLRASELGLLVLLEDVAAYQPWPSFAPHCAAKAAQASPA